MITVRGMALRIMRDKVVCVYINTYVQLHALQIESEFDQCAFFRATASLWTLFLRL